MNHSARKILITLALLGGVGLGALSAKESEKTKNPPWEKIFDGNTLFGWEGNLDIWRVENGAIIGETSTDKPLEKNTFLVWKGGDVADFDLKIDFKIESGNSGIQYRSQFLDDNWTLAGYQADLEAGDSYTGALYEERGRGLLAERGQKTLIGDNGKPELVGGVGDSEKINAQIKKDEWNTYEISARGRHFIHKINGIVTCEVTDNDPKKFADRGLLGLQVHAGAPMKVSFKNIQILRHKPEGKKKIVFMAGHRSHGYNAHEHRAGSLLLANQLNKYAAKEIYAEVRLAKDWPTNITALNDADAIVFYCDGGQGHMANSHLKDLDVKLKDGCGLACLHYGVETTKGENGDYFLKWIGGYFETDKSVNPHWVAEFDTFPDHPIANGVKPFKINDEWYFNMRFADGMKGVTPILSAIPPAETMSRPNGPHQGNDEVRKMVAEKQAQHLAWAYERPDGGRGFGFTGGHFHQNWGEPNFRKVVLNALAWIAKVKVPENGIASDEITPEILEENQDYPKP